jgi:hypothetical protein
MMKRGKTHTTAALHIDRMSFIILLPINENASWSWTVYLRL